MSIGTTRHWRGLPLGIVASGVTLACSSPYPFKEASYPKGSFGDELNQRFANHVRGCNIVEEAATRANPNRDYIPADLWTTLGDDFGQTDARLAAETSSRLLFLFPFTQKELARQSAEDPKFVSTHPTRALREGQLSPIGPLDGAQILPLRAAGTTIYRQSCSSYLNSAAQAGLQFGFGNIKAALNTEFNAHSNLLLFHGSFESPLKSALSTPGDARRYGLLLFWTNFYSDPDLTGEKPLYLKSFRGTVIARATINTRSTKVTSSAEASGSVGIFSGSLDVQAGFGEGSSLDASQFWVYLEHANEPTISASESDKPGAPAKGPGTAEFEAGPPLEVLQTEVQSAFEEAGTVPSPPILPGAAEHVQTFRVSGFPAAMCHSEYWELQADDATKTNVFSAEPTLVVAPDGPTESGYPRCRFEVHGTPVPNLVAPTATNTGTKEVVVKYEVMTRKAVAEKRLSARIARKLNVFAGPYPNVPLDAARVRTEVLDNGHIRPSWSISVPIVDPNGLLADLTATPPRLVQSDERLSCADADVVTIRVQVGSTDAHTLQLNIQGTEDFDPSQQPPALAARSCTAKLIVNVPIRQQVAAAGTNKPATEKIVDFTLPVSLALRQPFSRKVSPPSQ